MVFVKLFCLVALAVAELNLQQLPSSPASSLSANNPILLPFVLCSALISTVRAQFTNGDDESSDIDETIANPIVFDDDDNDFNSGTNAARRFRSAPQSFIQFEPRTYSSIVGVAIVITLLGLWASFDLTGGRLTGARLAAIKARAGPNGGVIPWLIWATPAVMSGILLVEQLAFLVIASIYVTQSMLQWTVLENPNGTQVVIAESGLFTASPAAGAGTLTITPIPSVHTNFPPFFFPIDGIPALIGGTPANAAGVIGNAEIVVSPSPIAIENTWYVYIVFFVLLAQFFAAFGNALSWRAGQYIAAAVALFVAWGLEIALIVFASLELSDPNPGQVWGEEIAILIFAVFATIVFTIVFAFALGLAILLRQPEYAVYLGYTDEELENVTQSTSNKKRAP
jgi:hypothetical protein